MNPTAKDDAWNKYRKQFSSEEKWIDNRDAMLEDFARIIAAHDAVAIGTVIDANCYRRIQAGPDAFDTADSNVFAFHNIIMRGLEKISTVDTNSTLSVIVDDDPEYAWQYYKLLDGLRQNPDKRFAKVPERVHAICFGNDVSYPGLQAADMLSWLARDFMVRKKTDPSAEISTLLAYLTHAGMHQPSIMDEKQLLQLAQNVTEAKKMAEQDELA